MARNERLNDIQTRKYIKNESKNIKIKTKNKTHTKKKKMKHKM